MASATPGLRLPSRPQSITALWLVPVMTEAHVCEQLAQGHYLVVERLGIEPATCRTQVRRRNHYTTKPHMAWWCNGVNMFYMFIALCLLHHIQTHKEHARYKTALTVSCHIHKYFVRLTFCVSWSEKYLHFSVISLSVGILLC